MCIRDRVPGGSTAPSRLDDLRFANGQTSASASLGAQIVAQASRSGWNSTSVLAPSQGEDDTLFTLSFGALEGFAYELTLNTGEIDATSANPESNAYRFAYRIGGGPAVVFGSRQHVEQANIPYASTHTALIAGVTGPVDIAIGISGSNAGAQFDLTTAWVKRIPLG